MTFREELEELINKHNLENNSNTPDWVLAEYIEDCLLSYAEYIEDCLLSYEVAIQKREQWHKEAQE